MNTTQEEPDWRYCKECDVVWPMGGLDLCPACGKKVEETCCKVSKDELEES